MMNFEPIKDRIVIKRDAPITEINGFIVPELAQERPQRGEILAVGTQVKDVKVGDCVLFGKNDGRVQEIEGQNVIIMQESQVMAIING